MTNRTILVDGSGFIHRAFHAIPKMNRKDGFPTNAIYGFTNMLMKLRSKMEASHGAIVFDVSRNNYRNEIYPEYKANRGDTPEEFIPQFPVLREVASLFGYKVLEKEGYEADDIIATICSVLNRRNYKSTIISSDKDLYQLITENIDYFDPVKDKFITQKEVIAKFGVESDKVVSVQSLIGDPTDNIPGVRGIGPVTAAKLVNKYGSLRGIFNNIQELPLNQSSLLIGDSKEKAIVSYRLALLNRKVPLGIKFKDLKIKPINKKVIIDFLKEYEMNSLIRKMTTFLI